jgi:hypothetical protein
MPEITHSRQKLKIDNILVNEEDFSRTNAQFRPNLNQTLGSPAFRSLDGPEMRAVLSREKRYRHAGTTKISPMARNSVVD